LSQVRSAHTKPPTPAPSEHSDTGGVAAGRTRQVLFADEPRVYAVGCGAGAEDSMDESACELPGGARDGVRGPSATSGQATPAASDNTKKRKSYTTLHHKVLELLCPALLHRSVCKDTRCSGSHHVLDVRVKKMLLDQLSQFCESLPHVTAIYPVAGAVIAVLREFTPCHSYIWSVPACSCLERAFPSHV
jgi:hypothetical protein